MHELVKLQIEPRGFSIITPPGVHGKNVSIEIPNIESGDVGVLYRNLYIPAGSITRYEFEMFIPTLDYTKIVIKGDWVYEADGVFRCDGTFDDGDYPSDDEFWEQA